MASDFEALEAQLRETRERVDKKAGRPLLLAVLVGLALGILLLASLLFWKPLFILFAGVLVGFAAYELASALRRSGRDIPRIPLLVACLAIVPLTFFFGGEGQWLATLGAVVLVTAWRLIEVAVPGNRVAGAALARDLGGGVFVIAYVAFLASFTVLLTAQDGGQWWTISFLVVIVATDTGAWATGIMFGRHPMAPSISPKKSWEGFAGSAVAALAAGVLTSWLILGKPWWFGLVLGAVMLAVGTMGDLTESLIKRDLGIKDIGTLLPGHGGFLDRLDSILPAGAAAFGLYLLFA